MNTKTKTIRVEFIPDRSNPPPLRTNNAEARKENRDVRDEVKIIMDVIKIGQSFKVFGLPYSKVSSLVHGVKPKDIHVTLRDFTIQAGYVQVWRSS